MNFYLAPLEGITTYAYRKLYNDYFPGMDRFFTPFLVPHTKRGFNSREQKEIGEEYNQDLDLVPQILSNHSEGFLNTVAKLKMYGYQEVNLNIGCPSKTVTRKGRGAGFLAEPVALERFLEEIFASQEIEISLKTRIGMSSPEEFPALLQIFNRFPVKELILHPRLGEQGYSGFPHFDSYLYALENSRAPVVYNGDIRSVDDYQKLLTLAPKTHSIMLGRGVIADPRLVSALKEERAPSLEVIGEFLQELLDAYQELIGSDKQALFKLKEIFSYMKVLFPEEKKLLKQMRKTERVAEYKELMKALFAKKGR
ncbi:tRNA dihydrouridine synthase [Ohessyouella blattaphilus]|uniref:tRNA-dihydrouridine synthase n=1 Tax=Ohessyouella blattaphilus TaxID=2949333 RepID=A0ABT1EGY0_9FIRM|nr:tRNA-dihydrouridine synthase family protein [Ohessyouella blattaphilus]MCP1109959.1 tRNA-dihydrouridine synthase family protein [Ohessyouella blattaphilus]MCR8563353.1 tRNA-dihydrouridine synthase family protein [Ohessyouella blattaphilus]